MTAAARVIPFPRRPEPKRPAVFSADPKHAGLRFERTASAAFRDAEYAQWFYPSPRPSLWRRILQVLR